ncbi:MAG: ATP-dependent DNA helicase RecG [Patescibacteria group bacterium]
MKLDTKISLLSKVGKTTEKKLNRLKIEKVADLLYYFPFRYEDYSKTFKINELKAEIDASIKAKIEIINNKRSRKTRKILTEALVSDDSGQMKIVWFNQAFIIKNLKAGDTVFFSGKVSEGFYGIQMISPIYEKEHFANQQIEPKNTHTARILPIYPLTTGITQKQIRFLISESLKAISEVQEWLPKEILEKAKIIDLKKAIELIHFPQNYDDIIEAQRRLKFDELFLLQLRAETLRQSIKKTKAHKIKFQEKPIRNFVKNLPFELTKDQKIAAWEIIKDMENEKPMNRLLEGDVGSGKTLVAVISALNVIKNNLQVVIMAPTEILAKQHFESFKKFFDSKIKIALITSKSLETNEIGLKIKKQTENKKIIFEKISSGEIDLVIGTQALLNEKIIFANLALVIVDEQHRFGVEQRKKIKEQNKNKVLVPHFFSMTATPIPRSFALTLYGDLDLSIIKTMPKNRKSIKTRLVEAKNRQKAYEFIAEQIKQGRQAFVICPLIESKKDTEEENSLIISDEKKTVLSEYEKLKDKIFPKLNIAYLHGKMKTAEKDEIMSDFKNKKIDILVSTSVIEVGIDIPNATVMMIEGADHFGLAQLHQFRGRVGRSEHQSYCFLFTESNASKALERLNLFESTNDGFSLAEYDLKMRGAGEVYGTAQSGEMRLKLASMKDYEIIRTARNLARDIDFDKYKSLKEKVIEWEEKVHLE